MYQGRRELVMITTRRRGHERTGSNFGSVIKWAVHTQPGLRSLYLQHKQFGMECASAVLSNGPFILNLPRIGTDQPDRPPPPGPPLGHRLRRDLLLPQQRPPRLLPDEVPATLGLLERRHIPPHLPLPHRLHLLPALSLFSGHFIVQTLNITFLIITIILISLAILEVKWSGIGLEEWWRNQQFWLISRTSAHLYAVVQGLLKVIAGIEISFTLTSKSAGDDVDDVYADLYVVRWTSLMIPPIVICMMNIITMVTAFSRSIYSSLPQWSKFIGGVFFSFWVLAHMYPFAKGLMGRRGKTPTIVFVWSGLIAITISSLYIAINHTKGETSTIAGGGGGGVPVPMRRITELYVI